MPGKWAEGLSPILDHETRHALKLFAVAGYQSGPKAKSLGRDEGIEHSNRRLRDGEPHLPVSIHDTVIEREYVEWSHHLGEQMRSEEHTSELQSLTNLVCRLLLEKKKTK